MAQAFKSSQTLRMMGYVFSGTAAMAAGTWAYRKNKKSTLLKAATQVRYNATPGVTPLNSLLASETTTFTDSPSWDVNWDRREPEFMVRPSKKTKLDEEQLKEAIEKVTPKATRHLILIRHGEFNVGGVEDSERYLTPLGLEQATFTGKRLLAISKKLKDLLDPEFEFTRIVNSTMRRALETADMISKELPSDVPRQSTDLLREGASIPPNPAWGYHNADEAFFEDGARMEAGFRKLFHRASPKQSEDSYEIVVCHANVIRYFVCRGLQLPPQMWLKMSTIHHCSITWVTIRPSGRVSLRSLGDFGHIPPEKFSNEFIFQPFG